MRAALAALLIAACASGSPRDVVPETREIRGSGAGDGGAEPNDAYVYVARRPRAVVALAEARQITDDDARKIVDRIADDLDRCAADLAAQGRLVSGAARVVAVAGPDGTPALNVRLAPGEAVAQNALVCLLAPLRAHPLPLESAEAGASKPPGLAIEVTWGP